MNKMKNGHRTLAVILGSIVGVGIIAISGFAIQRVLGHESLSGHPVLETKVEAMQKDILEIKEDVKTLLRR